MSKVCDPMSEKSGLTHEEYEKACRDAAIVFAVSEVIRFIEKEEMPPEYMEELRKIFK